MISGRPKSSLLAVFFVLAHLTMIAAGCSHDSDGTKVNCSKSSPCSAGYVCVASQPGQPGFCTKGADGGEHEAVWSVDGAPRMDGDGGPAIDGSALPADGPARSIDSLGGFDLGTDANRPAAGSADNPDVGAPEVQDAGPDASFIPSFDSTPNHANDAPVFVPDSTLDGASDNHRTIPLDALAVAFDLGLDFSATKSTAVACSQASDCSTNYCVGGICCNRACPGMCEECTAATGGQCTYKAGTACGETNSCIDASVCLDGGVGCALIDVSSLLDEMASLGALTNRGPNPFRTYMASSYDRESKVPQISSDTATDWYANQDWGNYLGTETGGSGTSEFVLLDTDGPGSIVRIWSATPSGTLRIYIDCAATPTLEAPMVDLLSGQVAPFLPPFAGLTADGANLEFPIPFRKHVRVTWDGAGFYQVTYRKYSDPATSVTSFNVAALDTKKLDSVRAQLLTPTLPTIGIVKRQAVLSASSPELTIKASRSGEEIVALRILPDVLDSARLRGSILSLTFDSHETVRAPLGDFFGAGPGLLPHATLPLEADADGTLTARFVMPFGQSAVVHIDAASGLKATVTVFHQATSFDTSRYYFHAHWIARGPIPSRPYRDILLADLTGEGAYVGTFLALGNSSTDWWGEGDEKVWVDDDSFPSLFGTGTEDYFGHAYCSPKTYNHPYRAQSLAAGGFGEANGLFSMLRTHVLDPIRFSTALKFNLELWHWDDDAQVTFDTVAYFYLAQNATDNLPVPSVADFRLSPFGP